MRCRLDGSVSRRSSEVGVCESDVDEIASASRERDPSRVGRPRQRGHDPAQPARAASRHPIAEFGRHANPSARCAKQYPPRRQYQLVGQRLWFEVIVRHPSSRSEFSEQNRSAVLFQILQEHPGLDR